MSGFLPRDDSEDAGIFEPLLGIAVAAIFFGAGWLAWSDGADPMILVAIVGIPGIIAVAAAYALVKNVMTLESYNPIYVVRKDLNHPVRIAWNALTFVAFYVVALLVWAFGVASPAEVVDTASAIWADQPELVYGFVGFNVLVVLGILFGSRSRGHGGHHP